MLVTILGICSGILAGLAVGGGTLLVPGLVLLQGTPQHVAQGISLFIFADVYTGYTDTSAYGQIRWRLAGRLASCSIIGAFLGAKLALRLPAPVLRKIFAVYLIAMGFISYVASLRKMTKALALLG